MLPDRLLVPVPPDHVSRLWDCYKEIVKQIIVPGADSTHEFASGNVLSAILSGQLVVWTYWVGGRIPLVLTTTFGKDGIAGGVNLIIYSFTAIEGNLTDSDWQYCIGVLKAYAKDNRLKNIIAYAEDPRLIERMKRLFKIGGFYIKEPIGD